MEIRRTRRAAWLRNALGIALAYALLFQVVLTGITTEPMRLPAMGGHEALCVSGGTDTDSGKAPPEDHGGGCAICAFHGPTPLLPPSSRSMPALAFHGTDAMHPAPLASLRSARHEPRTSQGPPLQA